LAIAGRFTALNKNFFSCEDFCNINRHMNRIRIFALIALTLTGTIRSTTAAGTNHNFGVWEKEIAAFEASDRTNPPPKHGLLFTGSSTIRKWTTLAKDYPNQPVISRGVGGSEVVDITHFADRIVFPYEPRMIFFRSGGNDIANGKSPERVFADFKEFVVSVHEKLPNTDIVFISWSATPLRWAQHDKEEIYNKLVKDYSGKTSHLLYCDADAVPLDKAGKPRPELFEKDRLHFNADGYKLLAESVRPFLPK
jgi:lysophospholipase L1-like esterase